MPTRERIAWTVLVVAVVLYYRPLSIVAPPPLPTERQLEAVLVHESGAMTPELARLVTELRLRADFAQYLSAKGHRLEILDQHAVDEQDRPILEAAVLDGLALPALVLYAGGQVIHREPLGATLTVGNITEIMRAHGG